MVDCLLESRKPAILGANAWFGGAYRLGVDPDGNCFATAWMVASLLWAVQTRRSLNNFSAKLKEAGQPGGAFAMLGTKWKVNWCPHLSLFLGAPGVLSLSPCCAGRAMGVAGTTHIDYLGGAKQQRKLSFVSAVGVFFSRHPDANGDPRTCPRPRLQRYTDRFIAYVDELKLTWDDPEPEHGISLAVSVVRELRGPSKAGRGLDQEDGREPAWLELKWGIALAARALDVKTAPKNLPAADMVSGLSVY